MGERLPDPLGTENMALGPGDQGGTGSPGVRPSLEGTLILLRQRPRGIIAQGHQGGACCSGRGRGQPQSALCSPHAALEAERGGRGAAIAR